MRLLLRPRWTINFHHAGIVESAYEASRGAEIPLKGPEQAIRMSSSLSQILERCDGREAEVEPPSGNFHWPTPTVPTHRDALMRSSPTYSRKVTCCRFAIRVVVRSGLLSSLPIIERNLGNPTDLEAHFVNNDITKVQYPCYRAVQVKAARRDRST